MKMSVFSRKFWTCTIHQEWQKLSGLLFSYVIPPFGKLQLSFSCTKEKKAQNEDKKRRQTKTSEEKEREKEREKTLKVPPTPSTPTQKELLQSWRKPKNRYPPWASDGGNFADWKVSSIVWCLEMRFCPNWGPRKTHQKPRGRHKRCFSSGQKRATKKPWKSHEKTTKK